MIYKHPNNPKITWEDGKRGRPPAWVVEIRSKKSKPISKSKKVVSDTQVVENGDPVSKTQQVLSDGSFRVNGRVIWVGPDCELITCAGDTIVKIG